MPSMDKFTPLANDSRFKIGLVDYSRKRVDRNFAILSEHKRCYSEPVGIAVQCAQRSIPS